MAQNEDILERLTSLCATQGGWFFHNFLIWATPASGHSKASKWDDFRGSQKSLQISTPGGRLLLSLQKWISACCFIITFPSLSQTHDYHLLLMLNWVTKCDICHLFGIINSCIVCTKLETIKAIWYHHFCQSRPSGQNILIINESPVCREEVEARIRVCSLQLPESS